MPYSAHHIEVSRSSRKYHCPSVSWDVALQGPVHLSLAKPRPIHAGKPGSYKSFRASRPFVPSICHQEFEIELEGSQSLRILCYEKCYDKTKVNKDNNEIVDKIMGKGQIQVRSQGETWRAVGQGCTVEESFSSIRVETHSPKLAPWCVPAAHRYWSLGRPLCFYKIDRFKRGVCSHGCFQALGGFLCDTVWASVPTTL